MMVFSYLWGVLRRLLYVSFVVVRYVLWLIALILYCFVFLFVVAFCWLLVLVDYILTGDDHHPSYYINRLIVFGERWMMSKYDLDVVRRFLRLE